MIDGIYSMTFRGATSWGVGMMVLLRGKVSGADAGGVVYDGQYSETTTELILDVTMRVPPGGLLVQGTPARATAYDVPFKTSIPKNAIDQALPVLVQLPPGPVNVIVRLLRQLSD